MAYSIADYAKAFTESMAVVPEAKKDAALKRFVGVVRKNGDAGRLSKIFEAVRTAVVRKDGGRVVVVETARKLPVGLLTELTKAFSKKDHIEVIENPALVAGTRITVNGEEELDNSLRRKLKKLFI